MTVFADSGKARTFDYQAGDVGLRPICDGPLRREHRR